jgi:hypothetical protein
MMMIFVRVCDADNVAEAACARSRADSMILSASGSMRSLEVSMFTTQGRTLDDASAHCAKLSA